MPLPTDDPPRIASARPEMTARLMARTGLDEDILARLVHRFYEKVRADPLLSPIFAAHVEDWTPHLARMVDFWSSVALMTGRYHGRPMERHMPLPVEAEHFERWLALFRETAHETCTPAGAEHVIVRAEKVADSIRTNIEDARSGNGRAGIPPRL